MKTAIACCLLLAVLIVVGPQLQACPTTASAESAAGPVPSANTSSNVGLCDVSGLITGVGGGGMGPITVNTAGGAGAAGAGGSTGNNAAGVSWTGGKGYTVGKVTSDGSGGYNVTSTGTNKVVFTDGTYTLQGNAPRYISSDPNVGAIGSVTEDPGGTIHLVSTQGMNVTTSAPPTGSSTGSVRIDFQGVDGTGNGRINMTGGVPGSPGALPGLHVDNPPVLPDANQGYLEGVGSAK